MTLGKRFMNALLSKKGELDLSGGEVTPTQEQETQVKIDYSKVAELVAEQMKETQAKANRENQRKENEILKSYFSQENLGLNEDEIKQAINDFKKAKKQEQISKDDEISRLSTRIKELEDGIKAKELSLSKKELNMSIKDMFKSMELKEKAINVFKIDESKAIKEDGTIDNEYVKNQVEAFKKEFPEFVVVQEQSGKIPGMNIQTGINKDTNQPQVLDINKMSSSEKWRRYYESKQ
jgi:hypothetical protein